VRPFGARPFGGRPFADGPGAKCGCRDGRCCAAVGGRAWIAFMSTSTSVEKSTSAALGL
jgi:hypothetical protein